MFRTKARAWLALQGSAAKHFALTEQSLATSTMLATLLACVWIFGVVGFLPSFHHRHLVYYGLTGALLLLLPVVLALALRTTPRNFLIVPYLAAIGLDLASRFILMATFPVSDYIVRYLLVSFPVVYVAPWILSMVLRCLNAGKKAVVYRVACALQLLLLIGAVYHFTYQYAVRHLADPVVSVRQVRFWEMPLSIPLIEEDAAYVVDRKGRLYRVELAAARKRLVAHIPRLTPAEFGLPAPPPVEEDPYSSPFWGVLTRTEADALLFRYEHRDIRRIVEVTVTEETGEVKWQAHEIWDVPPINWPSPSVAAIEVQGQVLATVREAGRSDIVIEGENIHTVVDALGRFGFGPVFANHGWALVPVHHRWWLGIGRLLIITVEGR